MSRWSAEPLHIALAPGEVALLGGRESRLRRLTPRTPPQPAAAARRGTGRSGVAAPPGGGGAVAAVRAPGADAAARQGARTCRRSARWSPPACVRFTAMKRLGWRVAVHSQPPHAGLVGAAIDADFLQQLEALLARHGCRTVAITPLASRACNAACRVLTAGGSLSNPAGQRSWAPSAGSGNTWPPSRWMRNGDALPEWLAREAEWTALRLPGRFGCSRSGSVRWAAARSGDGWHWHTLPHDAQAHGATALVEI